MLQFLPKEIHFVAGYTGLVSVGFLTGCVAGPAGGGSAAATVSPQVTPTPQIYSVSPGWITQSPTQPVTITVTGVNFTSDAHVLLDKSVFAAGEFETTYVSPTQLTATLSTGILAAPQMFSVSVDVPTASSSVLYSNAVNFFVMSANPRTDPSLVASFSSTYGSPIPAGAQNWLFQMFGTNLGTNSTIEVNGTARTTMIGGDGVRITEVTTLDFLPSEMAMPGSLQIVVISDPTIAPSAPTVLPVVAQ